MNFHTNKNETRKLDNLVLFIGTIITALITAFIAAIVVTVEPPNVWCYISGIANGALLITLRQMFRVFGED